jgi:hypothetical protein
MTSSFALPARERSDAFARLAEHAAAGELTVEYRETALEALPAIWDDFAAGRAQTKIIVMPNEATPFMTAPARTCVQRETTGLSPGFPAREPSPEASSLTSGNYQSLSAGQVSASSSPMCRSRWRHTSSAVVHE